MNLILQITLPLWFESFLFRRVRKRESTERRAAGWTMLMRLGTATTEVQSNDRRRLLWQDGLNSKCHNFTTSARSVCKPSWSWTKITAQLDFQMPRADVTRDRSHWRDVQAHSHTSHTKWANALLTHCKVQPGCRTHHKHSRASHAAKWGGSRNTFRLITTEYHFIFTQNLCSKQTKRLFWVSTFLEDNSRFSME